MSPIPLSALGIVFLLWLLGVSLVLAVLQDGHAGAGRDERGEPDPEAGPGTSR